MNRFWLPALLLALQLPTFSQATYQRMLAPGRSWDVFVRPTEWPICTYDYAAHYTLGKDTLMDGLWYQSLVIQVIRSNPPIPFCGGFYVDTTQSYPGGWVREDTIARRVYKREPVSLAEVLLFDFSLQQGDTLWYEHGGFAIENVSPFSLLTGEVRNAFQLDPGAGPFDLNQYVEGLGYLMGAFNQVFYPFEGWSETSCVRDGETVLYQYGPGCIGTSSGVRALADVMQIRVSPNPFQDQLLLRMVPQPEPLQFTLQAADGRVVFSTTIAAHTEQVSWILPDLPAGLYFWAAQGVVLGKIVTYDP